jgi:hypothetical protein
MDIVIEEHELEHIMFTIQHLVGPEVNRVAGLNSVAVAEGIQPLGTDKDAGAA